MSDVWTIGRLLTWTTDFLKERGCESPRLDAEVLLAHVRGTPRIALYTSFDEPASDEVRSRYRDLVRQRAAGNPVAYLVGRREFFALDFRVSPDVLIPRPETEFVLVGLLDAIKARPARDSGWRIVDVGTGSGILAITAAKKLPTSLVTAIDVSPAALAVARENAAAHGVADRITFVESDLFAALPAGATFDFLLSNPPYVTTAEWESLDPGVRDYEPRQALDAGPLGTEIIARLIDQGSERVEPGGELFMELSPMIEPAVAALLEADPRWERLPTLKDLASLPRVARARRRELK